MKRTHLTFFLSHNINLFQLYYDSSPVLGDLFMCVKTTNKYVTLKLMIVWWKHKVIGYHWYRLGQNLVPSRDQTNFLSLLGTTICPKISKSPEKINGYVLRKNFQWCWNFFVKQEHRLEKCKKCWLIRLVVFMRPSHLRFVVFMRPSHLRLDYSLRGTYYCQLEELVKHMDWQATKFVVT